VQKPDLLWLGAPTVNTEANRLEMTFKNAGNAPAPFFIVRVLVDNVTQAEPQYPSMGVGQSAVVYLNLLATVARRVLPGEHTYGFVVDGGSNVVESNERNNEFHGTLRLPLN
jgi:subtilase family serine protease